MAFKGSSRATLVEQERMSALFAAIGLNGNNPELENDRKETIAPQDSEREIAVEMERAYKSRHRRG